MAKIFPFRAYRYSARAGDPARLLTQPYDKISPQMQERYFSLSPFNVAHIIKNGEYTRAAASLREWIDGGILELEEQPAFFVYFQRFVAPDGGPERLRKGLIGLGAVEDYSQGNVFRHELTHTGPKRDRLELLRQTRAHCEQLFMLYDDPSGAVEARLDHAAQDPPLLEVEDEYGAGHCLWRISKAAEVQAIQRLMAPRKLLIADGHHRYETALAFRDENPGVEAAARVPMTFVNLRSTGLVILPTHRVVGGLADFEPEGVLQRAAEMFHVEQSPSLDALRERLERAPPGAARLGGVFRGDRRVFTFESRLPAGRPDAALLHDDLLAKALGLSAEAVREERHIRYVRGFHEAARAIQDADSQAVFFLRPPRVEQIAEVAFSGGVMPQKSTDFYPKMLSGLTIYRIDD